ncbi:hypothetical protein Tco_0878957 [Tanacetum coccineum]
MAAVEVPQTLEYRGGQLNAAPVLEVKIFTNWKKRFICHIIAKSTWDDLILYHEGPSDVKESRAMDLKLCYNTFKFKEGLTAIEESKDITLLSLDELIGNLKVREMIIKKDSKIVKAKVERKSIALKAKKESSDEECSTSSSENEEYAMAVRDFKKFFKRRGDSFKHPGTDKKDVPKKL